MTACCLAPGRAARSNDLQMTERLFLVVAILAVFGAFMALRRAQVRASDATLELVYAYAPTCSVCPAQKEVVADVVADEGGQMRLRAVNVHDDPEAVKAFSVRTVPSIYIVDAHGTVCFSRTGYTSRKQLRQALQAIRAR